MADTWVGHGYLGPGVSYLLSEVQDNSGEQSWTQRSVNAAEWLWEGQQEVGSQGCRLTHLTPSLGILGAWLQACALKGTEIKNIISGIGKGVRDWIIYLVEGCGPTKLSFL